MSLTFILIILTGLVSYQAMNNPEIRAKLLFRPIDIKNGEYYRFFSSGLIHADTNHLLFNMWALYIFGETIERLFINDLFGPTNGRVIFVLFYFSAVALASLPSYLRHQDNYGYSALGASGATSALSLMYMILYPWNWFIFPPLPAILLGVGYLWYSSEMDKRGTDNIGHNAHLWGALYGIAFLVLASLLLNTKVLFDIYERFIIGPTPPPFFN